MSRNMQLPIRCTYEELCQIRQYARNHNMNVSEYIRYLVAKEREEKRNDYTKG